MARPPAPSLAALVAFAGYVAFWAALIAVAVPRPPPPSALRTVPAHAPTAAAHWSEAHRVYDEVERRMEGAASAQGKRVARTILEEAGRAGMDPLLVLAVIQIESGFDPRAVSPVGAAGLMQLLGPTMREELARWSLRAADPFDPVANVRAGVRYLERMVRTFEDLDVALMAYNAGPGRIRRHLRGGAVPERFLEYPRSVTRARQRLSARPARTPRLAAVHTPPGRGAAADGTGGLLAPPVPRPLPALAPATPLALAVPAGSRRRDPGT